MYTVQLISWDSEMARSMGGAGWMARPEEDLEPRMDWIDDLSSENDSLHRSQHIVGLYAWFHFSANMEAIR